MTHRGALLEINNDSVFCGLLNRHVKEILMKRIQDFFAGGAYCSLGVEVSELADEGEQGPKYFAKTSNVNVQPPQKNYRGSFVRGPVRYSPDVPLQLNMAK